MKRTLTILGTIIGGIILIFGIVEGGRQMQWWGEPDELRAIKRESIVDGRLLGLELIDRREGGKYGPMKKETTSSVTLAFKSGNPSKDRDRIIQFAKDDGWRYTGRANTYDSWWAQKDIGNIELLLTIEAESSSVVVRVANYADY